MGSGGWGGWGGWRVAIREGEQWGRRTPGLKALGEPEAAVRSRFKDRRKQSLRSAGWHRKNWIPAFYVIYVHCVRQTKNTTT